MEIDNSQPEAAPSNSSQVDETLGCMPFIGGILGCVTAFFAYPILYWRMFYIFLALHVIRVTNVFEGTYSAGQFVLIWSLHVVLIALFALLYYARNRKGKNEDPWRSFAACALGWQILAGSLFALFLTVMAYTGGLP